MGVVTQGNQSGGMGGDSSCYLIQVFSWADKLSIKASLEDVAE